MRYGVSGTSLRAVLVSCAALLAACGDDSAGIPPPDQQTVQVAGRTLKPGYSFKDCETCPEMVVIPAGRFSMGTPGSVPSRSTDEAPAHTVTIGKAFAVGRFEVTKGEYAEFVRATGRAPGGDCFYYNGTQMKMTPDPARNWDSPGFAQSDRDPVVCINWDETGAYLQWLSQRTGQRYRLLSEAEWEFVARAGTSTTRPWGNDIGRGNANCDGCGTEYDAKRTSPAGTFPANAFGVRDMLGNVWERVEDCWHETYAGAPADGTVWAALGNCGQRVTRGGAWLSDAPDVRSALRNWDLPANRKNTLGFRVARSL
ncbi:MAG: formylglycine-generating enzyme family protein [Alphaproteobacteria bacterium]|nr:formylglycine-generating enzyme family protein [Alphaproteobacteria bacterium]